MNSIGKLEEIDKLLALIEVKGDSVIALASARQLLKEVYDEVKKNGKDLG